LHNQPAGLAHHFDDLEQQHEAGSFGMWLFLVTEILFFGGLFCAYTVYRWQYPAVFAEASHEANILLGGVNTAVLLGSSLTMALAVHAAQRARRKAVVWFLILTIVLGCVFLGIKAVEYHHKWETHHVPGSGFQYEGAHAREAQIYFLFYFLMTGMHALHMVIGVALLAIVAWMAGRGSFSAEHYAPVELSGLYWHFVDIVWIFLFPLLYLIDLHK